MVPGHVFHAVLHLVAPVGLKLQHHQQVVLRFGCGLLWKVASRSSRRSLGEQSELRQAYLHSMDDSYVVLPEGLNDLKSGET